jgi:hypothetical protein
MWQFIRIFYLNYLLYTQVAIRTQFSPEMFTVEAATIRTHFLPAIFTVEARGN